MAKKRNPPHSAASAKKETDDSLKQRGAIYWVDLNPTRGSEIRKQRPCVIVSITPINRARHTVVVVPLSTAATPRPPLVIPLPSVSAETVAVCDQIRAVDKSRLIRQDGEIGMDDLDKLEEALRVVLGL